jgi:hypothetical protein
VARLKRSWAFIEQKAAGSGERATYVNTGVRNVVSAKIAM